MKKIHTKNKYLIVSIVLLILFVAAWTYIFPLLGNWFSTFYPWCSDREYADKVYSPDGRYFVQPFNTSCGGAAGDIITNVILYKSDEKDFTNILTISGYSSIKASWINNRIVKIIYSNCIDGNSLDGPSEDWNEVKIIYEKQCSEEN